MKNCSVVVIWLVWVVIYQGRHMWSLRGDQDISLQSKIIQNIDLQF